MNKNIIFRLDAGNKFGLGHLSRCLALAEELKNNFSILFIIKTDDKNKVNDYLHLNCDSSIPGNLYFLNPEISKKDDLSFINKHVLELKGFLVLDHYSIDTAYQLHLKENNIKWFQFDSHADMDFYGDLVLHASPAATKELYKPLQKNHNTKFLLGTKYAIVSKRFSKKRKELKARKYVENILICFGGGNDKGATIKVLQMLNNDFFETFNVTIITSKKNTYYSDIKKFSNNYENLNLVLDSTKIDEYMALADLGLISPGTLSYESTCVGLPMLLVNIADNQNINAKGWVEKGCAFSLGGIEELSDSTLNNNIRLLINNPEKLRKMSVNCFSTVDGYGASRVKDEILSLL